MQSSTDIDAFGEALSFRVKSAIVLAGSLRKAARDSGIDHVTLRGIAGGGGASQKNLCRIYLWLSGGLPPLP